MENKQSKQTGFKIFFAFAVLAGIYFAYQNYTSEQPPPLSDKALYLNFCKQIILKSAAIDKTFAPFEVARTHQNMVGATKIALNIKGILLEEWGQLDSIEVPEFKNQKVADDAKQIKDIIVLAYTYRQDMIKVFLKAAQNTNTYLIAEFQDDGEKSEQGIMVGVSKMLEVGKEVGMTDNEIKALINFMKQPTITP